MASDEEKLSFCLARPINIGAKYQYTLAPAAGRQMASGEEKLNWHIDIGQQPAAGRQMASGEEKLSFCLARPINIGAKYQYTLAPAAGRQMVSGEEKT
eukprot:scaffold11045_cov78-Cyclotella_meneghiniana.AAC.2